MPKTERCKVNQPIVRNPNYIDRILDVVRNPNDLTTELLLKTPKSERSDFGRLLYSKRPKSEHVRISVNASQFGCKSVRILKTVWNPNDHLFEHSVFRHFG